MDIDEAVDQLLLVDEIGPRAFRHRKDETTAEYAERCLLLAGAAMRRAYGRGYLDAPLTTPEALADAQRELARAWARLPIPD